MYRSSSRATAGINNRYSSGEYVLASFMKGKKHAVIPTTSININPLDMNQAEIKICGSSTPLTIVSKGSKAQMNADKTNFARETGSEEVDLGQFVADEDEEKENEDNIDFDTPVRVTQLFKQTNSKESSTAKTSEINSSSPSNSTFKTNNKPDFDTVYNPPSTSRKRQFSSNSSLDGDEDEMTQVFCKKRSDINDDTQMLNKLLNRKKAPGKKKKKTTTTTCDEDERSFECAGCIELRQELKVLTKRVDRFDAIIPVVKKFSAKSNVGIDPTVTTTNMPFPKIQEINESIKEIFGVDANAVQGPRDRPTMVIRNLFTISNHVKDYRKYLDGNVELLQLFVQYRCPGIIEMKQTWADICKSMTTLESDIKKNAMTKQNRLSMKAQQSQQQLSNLVSTSDLPSAQPDPIQNE